MKIGLSYQQKVGVALSYLSVLVKIGTGLLYTPIMLKMLGESEYGIYSLCNSFMGYLTILNAGMNAAYIRFYVQTKVTEKEKLSRLNGTFLEIFAVISIISLVVGGWIAGNAEVVFGQKITAEEYEIIKTLFLLMTVNSACVILNCVFDSIVVANERFIFGKTIGIVGTAGVPIITVPLLLNGSGSREVAAVTLAVNGCILLINLFFCIRILGVHFEFGKDWRLVKGIFIFSSFIVIQSVMDQLNWQIDKFLLARFSGSAEIAVYTVGSQINSIYITIASAVTVVFIAQINRLTAQGKEKELSELFVNVSRLLCMVVMYVMTAYLIFGKAFIQLWAGEGYEMAFYVGVFLMLPVTVSLTQGLGQDIMRAKNIHKEQILINITVCILNLFISIPLCKKYGAIGGAGGTFIGEVVICVVIQYIYYEKVGKLDMKGYLREMKRIFPAFILPVTAGIVLKSVWEIKNFVDLMGAGGIYTFIYGCSLFMIGMNQEERNAVLTAIRKVRR